MMMMMMKRTTTTLKCEIEWHNISHEFTNAFNFKFTIQNLAIFSVPVRNLEDFRRWWRHIARNHPFWSAGTFGMCSPNVPWKFQWLVLKWSKLFGQSLIYEWILERCFFFLRYLLSSMATFWVSISNFPGNSMILHRFCKESPVILETSEHLRKKASFNNGFGGIRRSVHVQICTSEQSWK